MNLELKDAYVKYGKKYALKDFTYDFVPGKVYCVLGENGSGKTTMIKTLISKYSSSKDISYVAQEMLSNINLTSYDVVEMGRYNAAKFFGGYSEEDRKLISEAMETMDVLRFKDQIVDTLSGGEKQRVMTARALAQNTEWMILDEPSSSLDVRHTEVVMKTLKEYKENLGKSFIVVLHDINLAARYGDVFLFMKDGKLISSSDTIDKDILQKTYDTPFTEVKLPDGNSFFCPSL